MSKVVKLPPPRRPSFAQMDMEADAQAAADEAADAVRGWPEIDVENNPEDRARAVNGAMSSMEICAVTGAQFWAVFDKEPARSLYLGWARTCSAMLQDIVAEGERITGKKS